MQRGCTRGAAGEGRVVEVREEDPVEQLVRDVEGDERERPVLLDDRLLDEPAQALEGLVLHPRGLRVLEQAGRAAVEGDAEPADQLRVADPVEGGVGRALGDRRAEAEAGGRRRDQLRARLVVAQRDDELREQVLQPRAGARAGRGSRGTPASRRTRPRCRREVTYGA